MDEIGRDAAFRVKPDDESAILRCFSEFSGKRENLQEQISRAKKIASEYSWEKAAALTLDVYRHVLSLKK